MQLKAVCLLAAVIGLSSSTYATTIFQETLNAADNTALVGHQADIGGVWTGTATPIVGNAVDTKGGARVTTDTFTSALATNQILSFSVNNLATAGSFFGGGTQFAGYTLQAGASGGTIFIGDSGDDSTGWDVASSSAGGTGETESGNLNIVNLATLTYNFNTGAYALTLSNGNGTSGTTTPGLAIDRVTFSNNNGGDLKFGDTGGTTGTPAMLATVSATPEPASIGLLGLGAMTLLARRRRATIA